MTSERTLLVTRAQLHAMIDGRRFDDRGVMERALLALSWHGYFRASELADLDVDNVIVHPGEQLFIVLRNKRTRLDFSDGLYSASHLLLLWLAQAGNTSGPLFHSFRRSDRRQAPATLHRLTTDAIRLFFVRAAAEIGVVLQTRELVALPPLT